MPAEILSCRLVSLSDTGAVRNGSPPSSVTQSIDKNGTDPHFFPDHCSNYFFLLFGFLTSFF